MDQNYAYLRIKYQMLQLQKHGGQHHREITAHQEMIKPSQLAILSSETKSAR